MSHRSITVSDEAYELLSARKRPGESFTEVVKRLAKGPAKSSLLEYLDATPPNQDLADSVEAVHRGRRKWKFRDRAS